MVLVGLRTRLQGDETLPAPDIATATQHTTLHTIIHRVQKSHHATVHQSILYHTTREQRTHMKHLQVDVSTAQYLSWLLQPEDPKPTFYLLPVLSPTASNPSSQYEHWASMFYPVLQTVWLERMRWLQFSFKWLDQLESLGQWNCCLCREMGHRVGQWRFIFWRGGGRGVVGVWVNGDGIWGQKARVRLPSVHGHVRHGPPASLTPPLLQNTKD